MRTPTTLSFEVLLFFPLSNRISG